MGSFSRREKVRVGGLRGQKSLLHPLTLALSLRKREFRYPAPEFAPNAITQELRLLLERCSQSGYFASQEKLVGLSILQTRVPWIDVLSRLRSTDVQMGTKSSVNIQKLFSRKSPCQRLQQLYKSPVADLGDVDERLRGIFSPGYAESLVNRYMTGHFREDASTYVQRYQKTDYFENLLCTAFARVGFDPARQTELTILDIGSGAGNSVFPLLKLCPRSSVIASDLSAELLVLLKEFLQHQHQHQHEECLLFQLNAEELNFVEHAFDLVVGAATLHHLFLPAQTIEGCARILKPGGHAIFFEPFENGHAVLRLAYQDIVRDERQHALSDDSRLFLTGRIQETTLRQRRDKSHPEFASVDDKWLFTRQYFEELAERYHFSDCLLYPLYPLELVTTQFVLQTEINLRLVLGKGREALPDWAWQIIERYDNAFSEDLKKELLLEGTVIFTK